MTTIASVTTGPAASAAPRTAATAAAFRLPDAAAPGNIQGSIQESGGLAGTSPVSLDLMLAAEALDRDHARDSESRRRGQAILAGLSELQRALLAGGGDRTALLARLALLLNDMPRPSDRNLAAALSMIALRARIECSRGSHDTPRGG
jgi:hypothetical protein